MLTRVGLAAATYLLFAQTAFAQAPASPPPPSVAPAVAPSVAPLAPGAYGSKGTMEADGALALGYPTASGADFDIMVVPGFHYFVLDRLSEPARIFRRHKLLRGCAHGKSIQVSSRSAGASGPARF